MKTTFVLALLVLFIPLKGADLIRNTSTPLSKAPGKTLILKEKIRITDSDEDFYFKKPYYVKPSPDGSIFVLDEGQLLKFDSSGHFKGNAVKVGEGPGEVSSFSNFLIEDKKIVIHDFKQSKIVIKDIISFDLLQEIKLELEHYSYQHLLYTKGNGFFLLKDKIPNTKGKIESIESQRNLRFYSKENKEGQKVMSFKIPLIVGRIAGSFFLIREADFKDCMAGDDLMFISCTPMYEILLFNVSSNIIERRFNRQFARTAISKETRKFAPGGEMHSFVMEGKKYIIPVPDYHPDVQAIFFNRGKLWVATTELNTKGQITVDVFNKNGQYIDYFYITPPDGQHPLNFAKWIRWIENDEVLAVEQDKGGDISIVKYTITGLR